MTVTIKKIGGSVAVVIPKSVARDMDLTEGTALELNSTRDSIVMRKSNRRPRRSLRSIVAKIKPAAYRRRREIASDRPVGKEVG
jgi:AbrB family looped-hinge helix DNA binding protein